jgi:hypothetical protein
MGVEIEYLTAVSIRVNIAECIYFLFTLTPSSFFKYKATNGEIFLKRKEIKEVFLTS